VLPPAVIRRLRLFDDLAGLNDGIALDDQLLGSFQIADDLLRRVPGAFHGEIPGPVWPYEDSHSPWTDLRGARQLEENSRFAMYRKLIGLKFTTQQLSQTDQLREVDH